MDAVALAATIGGSVVALAGVGVTAWAARQQRESARELAASQHEHERALASGERLFEKRSAVYVRLIGDLQRWVEQVDRTEPIMSWANEPEPPEQPSPDEQRELNRVLRTFGSKPVADAYDECWKAVRAFFIHAGTMRTLREQNAVELPWRQLEEARTKVRADVETIERLVSDELAKL